MNEKVSLTSVNAKPLFFYESLSVKEDPVIQLLVASAQWWSVTKQLHVCSLLKKFFTSVSI